MGDEKSTVTLDELSTRLAADVGEAVANGLKAHEENRLPGTIEEWAAKMENVPSQFYGMVQVKGGKLAIAEIEDKPDEEEKAEDEVETVEMGGFTGVIERPINSLIPNVQLGSLAVGGFTGLLVSELVDGFVPAGTGGQYGSSLAKALAAILVKQSGKALVSQSSANVAATVMLVQVLAEILPIDQWVAQITSRVGGMQQVVRDAGVRASVPGGPRKRALRAELAACQP